MSDLVLVILVKVKIRNIASENRLTTISYIYSIYIYIYTHIQYTYSILTYTFKYTRSGYEKKKNDNKMQ